MVGQGLIWVTLDKQRMLHLVVPKLGLLHKNFVENHGVEPNLVHSFPVIMVVERVQWNSSPCPGLRRGHVVT